jgi:RNA polymerase sigma-70 factor (ECF subfamily)
MNQNTFSAFYSAHVADVWRFARRRTDSPTEADDITAEAFAVAWRRRSEVPTDGGRLWLFGVARNVLANHRRSHERRSRLHLRLATVDPVPLAYEPAPPPDNEVWVALSELSDDDQELLMLRAWDELSISEIATLLQISAANVSSRLYKARAKLRAQLQRRESRATGHEPSESHAEGSTTHDGF